MKKYRIKEGLVTRDIKGVYFVIDIHDRHFYRNKKVSAVNAMAYTIINYANDLKEFDEEDLAKHIYTNLKEPKIPYEKIVNDMKTFINSLIEKGWVYVI